MTTQKITRDKLVQAISELESWERNRKNEGYGSRLSIREEFQLQAYKELLAAIDIEPVSISHDTREFLAESINDALCQDSPTELDNQLAADIEKLLQPVYSVRPASIEVPDHMELIEKGRLWLLERAYRTLLDYRADNLWYWQGDEDDQPEILSCPVIMSAETLRDLIASSTRDKSDFIKHIKRVAKEVNEWPESKRWMLSDARVATDDSAVELLATELMKRIDKITGERHSLATLSSLRTSIVEVCRSAWRNKTERGE